MRRSFLSLSDALTVRLLQDAYVEGVTVAVY
jgi:hypothetical protein